MIITISKRSIIFAMTVIIALTAICLPFAIRTTSYAGEFNGKIVVLDAGHGGIDGGVVGKRSDAKESDINLAICRALESYLVRSGFTVVFTRKTTDGLYDLAASNRKKSDMLARKRIIENAAPDLVVSIHLNQYPLESVHGAQVFYAANSEDSAKRAQYMQSMLNTILPECNRSAKSGDYYILNCTQYPSMLIECGFLSNAREEALLVTSEYQDKVAYAIYSGIVMIMKSSVSA